MGPAETTGRPDRRRPAAPKETNFRRWRRTWVDGAVHIPPARALSERGLGGSTTDPELIVPCPLGGGPGVTVGRGLKRRIPRTAGDGAAAAPSGGRPSRAEGPRRFRPPGDEQRQVPVAQVQAAPSAPTIRPNASPSSASASQWTCRARRSAATSRAYTSPALSADDFRTSSTWARTSATCLSSSPYTWACSTSTFLRHPG